MTGILQISDTHIVAEGALVSGRLATDLSLSRIVDHLAAILDRIGPVDALLISGDISDDGSPESYQRFLSIMAALDLPMFVIPGNHDRRDPMRRAFSGQAYLPESGKLNWHQRVGDIDLIGLDTLIEGSGGGEIDASTLDFLSSALDIAGHRPVLLALHHPPFDCGIAFMDRIGLAGSDALAQVLSEHKGELRIVCGHIHSMVIANVGGKVAISAPSPCSSFAYDTRPNAIAGFHDLGDGCLLHRWQRGFCSIRIAPSGGNGPFPF